VVDGVCDERRDTRSRGGWRLQDWAAQLSFASAAATATAAMCCGHYLSEGRTNTMRLAGVNTSLTRRSSAAGWRCTPPHTHTHIERCVRNIANKHENAGHSESTPGRLHSAVY